MIDSSSDTALKACIYTWRSWQTFKTPAYFPFFAVNVPWYLFIAGAFFVFSQIECWRKEVYLKKHNSEVMCQQTSNTLLCTFRIQEIGYYWLYDLCSRGRHQAANSLWLLLVQS